MPPIAFRATIESQGPGAYIVVPVHVVEELGGGGRIPVLAMFADVPYRGSVVTMGGEKVIGITKAIRETMGRDIGDTIEVKLARDEGERTVDVPDDLRRALKASGVEGAFAALAYTQRREHVRSIDEAKKPETRSRRIDRIVESLET